jgi:hypothetical protein
MAQYQQRHLQVKMRFAYLRVHKCYGNEVTYCFYCAALKRARKLANKSIKESAAKLNW